MIPDPIIDTERDPASTVDLTASPTTITIRALSDDDRRYAVTTWLESYKESRVGERMPWAMYKQTVGKEIADILDSARVIAAYTPRGRVVGWLAYTPGRSISVVHWAYTRRTLEDQLMRRRGVMSALLDAASLGSRFAYTHRGARRQGGQRRRGPGLDVAIAEWLAGRGVTAVYVPYADWK